MPYGNNSGIGASSLDIVDRLINLKSISRPRRRPIQVRESNIVEYKMVITGELVAQPLEHSIAQVKQWTTNLIFWESQQSLEQVSQHSGE
mgnify:CR=1 FL=1